MKKYILAIIALFLCSTAFAQSNLVFNAPVFIELNVTGTSASNPNVSQTVTIPAGKIWKIESASASYRFGTSPNIANGASGSILINDKTIYYYTGAGVVSQTPIWLPAGTYTFTLVGGSGSTGNQNYGFVSGIEFNLTQ